MQEPFIYNPPKGPAVIYPSDINDVEQTSIAICIMIKDDHDYIEEWLTHHRELGVDHFYFYDNESVPGYVSSTEDITVTYWNEDQYFEPIYPIINPKYYNPDIFKSLNCSDIITTHWPNYPERSSKQFKAYQHCLNNFGRKHKWIAFIDSDEFINVGNGLDLPTVLSLYDKPHIGQLLMKWRMFSSSGHQTKQPLQKQAYTDWFPDYQVKTFVRPDRIVAIKSLHIMPTYPAFLSTTEDHELNLNVSKHTHSSEVIWVNHYWSRSRQDFEETKINRKGGTTLRYDEHYEAKFEFIEKRAAYHMKKLKQQSI
jgi:hypothetical protein